MSQESKNKNATSSQQQYSLSSSASTSRLHSSGNFNHQRSNNYNQFSVGGNNLSNNSEQHGIGQSLSTSALSSTSTGTSNNNNNNYVTFTDFMLQHNISNSYGNGNPSNCYQYYPHQFENNQTYYSDDRYYNNIGFNGDSRVPTQRQQQYFYGAATSNVQSNLLPTATEFIPRFNNLSLNEQQQQNNHSNYKQTSCELDLNSGESQISINQQIKKLDRNRLENNNFNGYPHDNYDRNNLNNNNNNNNNGNNNNNNNRNNKNNRNQKQKFDNYRHNKRRDNWNRNRNERELSEHIPNNNGKTNDSPKSNKSTSPNKLPKLDANEKLCQRDKLIKEIEVRRLECPVCVELIKTHQNVWSCQNCYHIFHLNCIIKWASSSRSDEGWRCPACQNISKPMPRDYYCFCGKVKNPEYNRNDLPHSCGELCGKKDNCVHPCTLLCHPGPCPPCQALVTRKCGCGRTTKSMQCYLKTEIECDLECEKLLNCELHNCAKNCHHGKCPACDFKIEQKCHCGKQDRQVPCTRDSNEKKNYSCGKACNKDLLCGNHKCKDCCHAGDCKPCKLSPDFITSCPCGKMPVTKGERNSCLDPVPVCAGNCGKTLKCGPPSKPHHCSSKCHIGNCPPCNKQTAVKCRCGHIHDIMIKCRQLSSRADDARCKKRCTKKRSCGKHKCNQECCIDIDHICPLPCNYTLSCGKHKCDQPCHRGNCMPCYRSSFEELYCECGAEVIFPPVPCGTKKPACNKPCTRQHSCSHEVTHNCHSTLTCPPCIVLTTKWCFGHHEQRKTIPCNQESFSCGLACNRPLPCEKHKCIKPCHEAACQLEGEICKQNCTTSRSLCGHKCNAPCHRGDCPETLCREMIEVTCQCGNRKQQRTCHEFSKDYKKIQTAALASSMAEMQRGNCIELSDIMGPIKMTSTKTLECNEECRVLERNRRLAIGLQIRNPDTQQKLLTRYSDFIRNWYKKDPYLVKNIHDALTDLVQLAKTSQQKNRRHSFPTMNRDKRQLVHEMCGMFGVYSQAFDNEPNRNVVATAYKDRSWLPAMSIMEVMKRESGQRRPPVNNAWGVKK